MPYPWGREDHNLINYYRMVGQIRRNNEVYKEGDFKLLHLDDETLVFERYDDENAYVTFVNNSSQYKTVEFSSPALALCKSDEDLECKAFELPAYTAQIFKTKRHIDIYF